MKGAHLCFPHGGSFLVNSSNHSGRSSNKFPCTLSWSLFFFYRCCLGLAPGLSGPRGVHAYFVCLVDFAWNYPAFESCGTDVAGVLSALELEDPVDKPGATIGTKFSVLHGIVLHHQSTHRNIIDLRRVFPKDRWCILEELYRHEQIQILDVHCCFLVRLHFSTGREDRCGGSGHSNGFQSSRNQIFPAQHVY